MTKKTIIARQTLEDLVTRMTEVQALTLMSRIRAEADREGKGVTRIIRNGKVQEQILWMFQ